MRASLNEIRQLEEYLSSSLPPDDRLVLDARVLLDPVLRLNLAIQKKVYKLIALYGRKKLKAEIQSVHQQIFQDPDKNPFQLHIRQLFKKD